MAQRDGAQTAKRHDVNGGLSLKPSDRFGKIPDLFLSPFLSHYLLTTQ